MGDTAWAEVAHSLRWTEKLEGTKSKEDGVEV